MSPCDLDVAPDSNLIQNGDPDAVAISLGGTIVDTVSYRGNTGAPYTEGSGAGLDDDRAPSPKCSVRKVARDVHYIRGLGYLE